MERGVRVVHPWREYRGVGEEQLHPPHFLFLEHPDLSPPNPLLQKIVNLVCGVRVVHPWRDYRGVGAEL